MDARTLAERDGPVGVSWDGDEETTLARQGAQAIVPSDPGLPLPGGLPHELVLQPGSFTVSTMSVLVSLFMLLVTVAGFAVSGLIAGVGVGLALLSMMM